MPGVTVRAKFFIVIAQYRSTKAIPNLYAVRAEMREERTEINVIDITIAGECLRKKARRGVTHQRSGDDLLLH